MAQSVKDYNFSEIVVNEDIPLRSTNAEGEKSNKCNQCGYEFSVKSSLKYTVEKSQTNATNATMHPLRQAI